MTNKSIEIQPGMGVYKVFKHLKYKPWFAIAEFIDNSLQSFLSKDGKYYFQALLDLLLLFQNYLVKF